MKLRQLLTYLQNNETQRQTHTNCLEWNLKYFRRLFSSTWISLPFDNVVDVDRTFIDTIQHTNIRHILMISLHSNVERTLLVPI